MTTEPETSTASEDSVAGETSGSPVETSPAAQENAAESVQALTAPASTNQRSSERQLLSGRARVLSPHAVAEPAKVLDANAEGVSLLMDLALKPGSHFTLHLVCFHHGKSLDAHIPAVCIHSTLSGRGFKNGFRFENLPDPVKTDFLNLLN